MKCTKWVATVIGAIIGLGVPISMSRADPGTLPLGQLPMFTAEWWQWAYSLPLSQSPLTDSTGERCMFGQRGQVWFLAGFAGSGSATRNCSVPEGSTLFFPIINVVNFNTPNLCGNGPKNLSLSDLRQFVKQPIDGAHDLSVSVDGTPIKKNLLQRVRSQVFEVALPGGSGPPPIDNLCVDLPGGIYSPAVDDGYYVSLGPLSPGSHTIYFHVESDLTLFGHFVQDVTYNLVVTPVSLK